MIFEPVMSSLTMASWADSGTIKRDSPDTCVVEVRKNGYVFSYSIDMKKGLIIASVALSPGAVGSSSHRYVYGESKGIYYIRKVCCFPDSTTDTTINNGGYEFHNIRINNEPVTQVINTSHSSGPRFAIRVMAKNGGRKIFFGGNEAIRINSYDLRGRRLFSMLAGEETGIVQLDQACASGRCPSGGYIIRVQAKGSTPISGFSIR
jgi:hypothetical protein